MWFWNTKEFIINGAVTKQKRQMGTMIQGEEPRLAVLQQKGGMQGIEAGQ
jgi:hypothetical protein